MKLFMYPHLIRRETVVFFASVSLGVSHPVFLCLYSVSPGETDSFLGRFRRFKGGRIIGTLAVLLLHMPSTLVKLNVFLRNNKQKLTMK